MRILLVSTYELGHQPLHVASPAAALREAGHEVRAVDLSVEMLDAERAAWPDAVAFSVPMHTAMRIALRTAESLRSGRPGLPICLYGLYAQVSAETTLGHHADRLISGEYEPALVEWAGSLERGTTVDLGRGAFRTPSRELLPPLERYAKLDVGGEERLAGYVEASHGCVHKCRHCPLPVVYDGRIRIVERDVVLADIDRLVELGARHITFGDPDFLNGRRHSLAVAREMHERHPQLTFDCTTKVEHILEFPEVWPLLAEYGCLFVVSALECVNDEILARLDKGHTTADARAAVALLRRHGIEMRPSFMPFTPWTTTADVAALLDFVAENDLIGNVDPVQYTIRLLLPEGSLLLEHPDMRPHLGAYDGERLSYGWRAADPAADELHARLSALVERSIASGDSAGRTFARVRAEVSGEPCAAEVSAPERPRLTEAWFCCAEPTEGQLAPARVAD